MQALAGVRKQEAALKSEREGLAERLRAAEADSTARVRQAVEVVEDLKVLGSCMPVVSVVCMERVQQLVCTTRLELKTLSPAAAACGKLSCKL